MAILGLLISIVSLPVKWLLTLVRVADLEVRLRRERVQLKRLRELEEHHLESLRGGSSTLISVHLEDIHLGIL